MFVVPTKIRSQMMGYSVVLVIQEPVEDENHLSPSLTVMC